MAAKWRTEKKFFAKNREYATPIPPADILNMTPFAAYLREHLSFLSIRKKILRFKVML